MFRKVQALDFIKGNAICIDSRYGKPNYFCLMENKASMTDKEPVRVQKLETPEDILITICQLSGYNMHEVKSKSHKAELAMLRHIYCIIANIITTASHEKIGRVIERDRTTTIYAIRKAKDMLATNDKPYTDLFSQFSQRLTAL